MCIQAPVCRLVSDLAFHFTSVLQPSLSKSVVDAEQSGLSLVCVFGSGNSVSRRGSERSRISLLALKQFMSIYIPY